ncbi:ribosomal protein L6, alpha-beta domain-containing protein [Blyttiomyces helicus]|uniref:Ribosomal protein L6, alpha-beta domain-containing protein n=1 Tax=Blyttiomyces helicus TaxID=388810 RepID=A0A4P9WIE4_9FUNG|nr:ribosomal protein L6, alpha-beta domain-containing protein [Blyttiomyces helicus]|eukprot:RKO92544.1 ribosomal protein L6, alpha-beta domain-containing protein [Blyttiomyces helicus]
MIGRQILKYPPEVEISLQDFKPTKSYPYCKQAVVVKGPRGTLRQALEPFIRVDFLPFVEGSPKRQVQFSVTDPKDKRMRAMWGTIRQLVNNMVEGVTEGFTVPLRFQGVGYRAVDEKNKVGLKLGYSHDVAVRIPRGVKVQYPAPTRLILQGNDKQVLTQFAALIRSWKVPEPYNQKGIFVGDETIKKKEGKKR